MALEVIDRAIQMHGGAGRQRRHPAGRDVGGAAHAADRRRPRRGAPARHRPTRAATARGSAMSVDVPGAGPVRDEDAFDVAALDAWLRARSRPAQRTCPTSGSSAAVRPTSPSCCATRAGDLGDAPPPGRAQGGQRPRHAPRVRDPADARAVVPRGPRDGGLHRRSGHPRLGVLRHGARARADPARRPASRPGARPARGARPGAGHVRLPGRPALGGHRRQRTGRLLAGVRVRAPPGRGLVRPLPRGPDRRRPRRRGRDGLAGRPPARRTSPPG